MGKITNDRKGIHFACDANDNEIIYNHEDGDDNGEFLFGNASGVGGWTIIDTDDLVRFMRHLGFDIHYAS